MRKNRAGGQAARLIVMLPRRSSVYLNESAATRLTGRCTELSPCTLNMVALNGVHPRVMQELAGHSDPQTTMQIYTHVNLDAKRQAANIFAGALTA